MSHSHLLTSNQFPVPIHFLSKHLRYPFLSIPTAPGSCPKCHCHSMVSQWASHSVASCALRPGDLFSVICVCVCVGGGASLAPEPAVTFQNLYLFRLTPACITSYLLISKTSSLLQTSPFMVPGMCSFVLIPVTWNAFPCTHTNLI